MAETLFLGLVIVRKFHIVIVGAGPISLYLALRLIEAGISVDQLIIVDPRQNQYIRPGQVFLESLTRHLSLESGPLFKDGSNTTQSIKDVERALYELVTAKKILIESKQFIDFMRDTTKKGIIISDVAKNEELIECDYVFDCTGTKRKVIEAVNNRFSDDPPFTISPVFPSIPAHHFVLANIKTVNPSGGEVAFSKREDPSALKQELYNQTPLEFAQHMKKLHALGWKKEFYPISVLFSVGSKDKACFYSEAPETLSSEDLLSWVKTVMEAKYPSKLSIEELKPSQKYPAKNKLRLTHLTVTLDKLNRFIHQAPQLPKVIPQGDAIHSPHFFLGEGISYGCNRVNHFISNLLIAKGLITNFDQEDYEQSLNRTLVEQDYKEAGFFIHLAFISFSNLLKVMSFYQKAIAEAADNESGDAELPFLHKKLAEINQHILAYQHALGSSSEELAQYEPCFAAEITMLKKALTLPRMADKTNSDDVIPFLIAFHALNETDKQNHFNLYLNYICDVLNQDAHSIQPTSLRLSVLSYAILEFSQRYKQSSLFFSISRLINSNFVDVCLSILQYRELLLAQALDGKLDDTIQVIELIDKELSENQSCQSPPPITQAGFFSQDKMTVKAKSTLSNITGSAAPK